MHFEIEKPTFQINYFTLIIKYSVLAIVLFIGSWVIFPLAISQKYGSRLNSAFKLFFDNPYIFSVLFAVIIIGFLVFRTWKKYKYGEVYYVEFNDDEKILNIKSVNLINNQIKEKSYAYKNITFLISFTEDPLFGKQEVLSVKNKGKKVHTINFARTAWCRHKQLNDFIKKIRTF